MDSIELKKLDYKNVSQYKVKLLQSFNYHPVLERKQREYGFLEETIKLVQKEKSIMYLLIKDDIFLGCISLSASNIKDNPSCQIDYLFVDYNYRKQLFKELDNILLSEYLILSAIQISEKVREYIALKYLVLYPDRQSKKLVDYYKTNFRFNPLTKEWLCLKLY